MKKKLLLLLFVLILSAFPFLFRETYAEIVTYNPMTRLYLVDPDNEIEIIPRTFDCVTGDLVDSGIDYTEILDEINNPERGFYSHRGIVLTSENSQIVTQAQVNNARHLMHLRIDIRAFGREAGGIEFTDNALNALNQTMQHIRAGGRTAILRFAYDWSGAFYDGEYVGYEPEMWQILRHIEQLTDFFHDNEDVITAVETGFLGPWGEQHASPLVTTENMNALIDALLLAVPETRTISVRQPEFFANWVNHPIGELNQFIAAPGTPAHRVGVYNDGYLGTHNDMGTYRNREVEINWLRNQGLHTFFGGEVVAPHNSPTFPWTQWNDVAHAAQEMFITRTAYLNIAWRGEVLDMWRNTPYTGSNEHYHGMSGFDFINNHMGYRYVIRDSRLSERVVLGGNLQLEAQIENVGAGNKVNKTELTALIVLVETGEIAFYERTNIDIRTWNSQEISNVTLNMIIPEALELGKYHVYFKMMRPDLPIEETRWTIQFANDNVWNEELGANFMGEFLVIEHECQKLGQPNNSGNGNTNEILQPQPPRQPATVSNRGWREVSGQWFNYNNNGQRRTGWISVGGYWYFMNPQSGQVGHTTNLPVGAMRDGWVSTGGRWYFMNPVSGRGGHTANLPHGAMRDGWISVNGQWYFMNPHSNRSGHTANLPHGAMRDGWVTRNGNSYFLNPHRNQSDHVTGTPHGAMLTGIVTIGKNNYRFDASGRLTR